MMCNIVSGKLTPLVGTHLCNLATKRSNNRTSAPPQSTFDDVHTKENSEQRQLKGRYIPTTDETSGRLSARISGDGALHLIESFLGTIDIPAN